LINEGNELTVPSQKQTVMGSPGKKCSFKSRLLETRGEEETANKSVPKGDWCENKRFQEKRGNS